MTVLVLVVFATNVILNKPAIDSLLFALALAVGMAPELLPAINSITLSHGAQKMAKQGVIVRRLNSIENFGSMDVLCTDKNGTLTEGVAHLEGTLDADGNHSNDVLRYAYLNATYQSGLNNSLDEEIKAFAERSGVNNQDMRKMGEIPYDFVRKRPDSDVQLPEVRFQQKSGEMFPCRCHARHDLPARDRNEPYSILATAAVPFRMVAESGRDGGRVLFQHVRDAWGGGPGSAGEYPAAPGRGSLPGAPGAPAPSVILT